MRRFDLQRIPREIVYGTLFILLLVPFFVRWQLPVYVSPQARGIFDALEEVHAATPDKPVFIFSGWGPGTQGENRPQMTVFIEHLVRLRQPFVVFAPILEPIAPAMSRLVINEVIQAERERAEAAGEEFDFAYGTHYANLGFKGVTTPTIALILQALERDLPELVRVDFDGTPLDELPLMRDIQRLSDFSMLLTVGAGDDGEDIVGIFSPQHPEIPVGVATVALVATRLYPYVDSGQFVGLLDGLNGANEYRQLLHPEESSTMKGNAMTAARLFIVLLIVIGNIGMLIEHRRRKRGEKIERVIPQPPGDKLWLDTMMIVITIIFVIGLLAEMIYSIAYGTGFTWLRLGAWIAAYGTIGMLSFALGDNKLYRGLEHVVIGSIAAYSLYQIINNVLKPNLYDQVMKGGWHTLWLLVLIPSGLWFTIYFKSISWMNKLVVGMLMGMTVGLSFQNFINRNIPQVVGSFKPLVTFTPDGWIITTANVVNAIYVLTMIFVLLYFIFFLTWKSAPARGVNKLGRILMMIAFGALFGNTVSTRISWLIDRIDALVIWIKDMPFFL